MNRRDRRFLLREIGVAARRARRAGGWSQARVAGLAGTSQATVSRIEAAHPGVSTAALLDVLAELGLALRLADEPAYVAERTAQRDPAHARCAAYVGRHLERLGWMVAHEVEVGRDRFRGWIDLLAFHPSTGTLLLIEIKTVLVDVGALQRQLGWYEREAWAAARRKGWSPRRLASALFFLATAENDGRLVASRGLFEPWAPGRFEDLSAGLADPRRRPIPNRSVVMIDPRRLGTRWLIRSRIEGRRSPLPYRDYADFMRPSRR